MGEKAREEGRTESRPIHWFTLQMPTTDPHCTHQLESGPNPGTLLWDVGIPSRILMAMPNVCPLKALLKGQESLGLHYFRCARPLGGFLAHPTRHLAILPLPPICPCLEPVCTSTPPTESSMLSTVLHMGIFSAHPLLREILPGLLAKAILFFS